MMCSTMCAHLDTRMQVWRLDPALQIPNDESLWGCFSWVEVPAAPGWDVPGALALDDAAFAGRQAALREALRGVEVEEMQGDVCTSE